MKTKEGKYGTLYRYQVVYQSSDPCRGHITAQYWGYSEEDAYIKWQDSFDSDYDLHASPLVSIKPL